MAYTYGVRPIWETHPESVDALRAALARELSAGQTANELSERFGVPVTRNMVCGKAFRLGLMLKGDGANAEKKTAQAKPKKLHKTVFYFRPEPAEPVAELPPEPIAIPVSRRVQLLDLTFNSCRWPLGDPRHDDFAFCGADRVKPNDDSNAYCEAHAAIAFCCTQRSAQNIAEDAKRRAAAIKRKATTWTE